jgi:hypothetical protein
MKLRQGRKSSTVVGLVGLSTVSLLVQLWGSRGPAFSAIALRGDKQLVVPGGSVVGVGVGVGLGVDPTAAPSPPPPPPLSHYDGDDRDRPDGFSACLMWMDDNFRLVEWLAYHYYMLNLRHVVVHVDPYSRTRPYPVLDRWKDRMRVVVWTHPSNFTNKTYDIDEAKYQGVDLLRRKTLYHRSRQVEFYHGCARHLQAQNRSWTSFHDVDEYLVATDAANVTAQDIEASPGVLVSIFQKYSRRRDDPTVVSRYNASILYQFRDWDLWFSARPCVVLPRVLIGAKESPEPDVARAVPDFLDPYRFDTFRWRHQGTRRENRGGPGKGFVDLSRLPSGAYSGRGKTHQPFGDEHCTHPWATGTGPPLMMNHYIGSWEAYSYREDARKGTFRSFEAWKKKSEKANGGVNDVARHWITGFVNMVGDDAAKALLRDAGLPRNYSMPENETAGWAYVGG